MEEQSFFQKYKVLIGGLFMTIVSTLLSVLSPETETINWYLILWNVALAALSYFGNNLRGQLASVFGTAQATLSGFFILNQAPGDISRMELIVLGLSLFYAIGQVFFTSPAKSREYEHAPTIVAAKQEAKTIIENKEDVKEEARDLRRSENRNR